MAKLQFLQMERQVEAVGGDLAVLLPIDDINGYRLVLLDVVSHGRKAYCLRRKLTGVLHRHGTVKTCSRLMSELNAAALEASASTGFAATALAVDVWLPEKEENDVLVRWSGAGHLPAIMANHDIYRLESQHMPLGIDASCNYESDELSVPHPLVIVAYTDGVVELAGEPRDKEVVPEIQAAAVAGVTYGSTPKMIIDQLTDSLNRVLGDSSPTDDLTIAVATVRAPVND